ncbi:hypothetical protein LY90DRAFT_510228 [Neocallimastix californiae]|jgi:hypothetical protein|uniref:Transglutaminase-like domain-containing protein n=1 Tax=Neocallimastix californiae TaxID=1754190 RepID=A0A1Y2C3B0_9FUNG|nr:hypothetical protein LY90DRAFT_510228 [Neocallimastix californiae]|eukprot:ORY41436.1 hypothetical protein LY90DRAFT_510228 [Neocallimastix californiae]
MKCLGTFFVFVLLNLVTVFAGPPPHEYFQDNDYEYFTQEDGSNQCYITNVINKKATTLYINPYVYHNGKQLDIMALAGGLADCAVTKIVIPHYIYHYFSIWGNVLSDAKNLKELQINSLNEVGFFDDTFKGVNGNLQIHGQGVDNAMKRYAKQFLQDNYPDLIKNWSREATYQKQCGLYQIAKIVNKQYAYTTSTASADNGASALVLKQGSTLGLARVVRTLAIAAGFSENDILVGGDDVYHGFNYVKFSGKWYILDSVKTYFSDRDMCTPSVFQTSDAFIKGTLNPFYGRLYQGSSDNFVIYHGKYGCPNENPSPNPVKENFKKWLSKNNKGTLA